MVSRIKFIELLNPWVLQTDRLLARDAAVCIYHPIVQCFQLFQKQAMHWNLAKRTLRHERGGNPCCLILWRLLVCIPHHPSFRLCWQKLATYCTITCQRLSSPRRVSSVPGLPWRIWFSQQRTLQNCKARHRLKAYQSPKEILKGTRVLQRHENNSSQWAFRK